MTAQALREKIGENAMAWRETADEEKRRALHQENTALYKELDGLTGSTSVFDPETGRWSTASPGSGDYVGISLPAAKDLSPQVKVLQEAAAGRATASLDRAKEKAGQALDREAKAIGETYREARNQAAARSEIEKRDLGERAAQSGLNSGAAGQLALSQSMAAQGALGALDRQEAQARDEVNAARREMEADHAYAAAEAEAEGDYSLADALYREAVRYDESRGDRAYRQAGLDKGVYDSARSNRQWEAGQQAQADKLRYDQEQDDRSWESSRYESDVKLAQSRAAFGDFQGYARLGYSQEEIARMTQLWRYYQFIR